LAETWGDFWKPWGVLAETWGWFLETMGCFGRLSLTNQQSSFNNPVEWIVGF